MHMTLIPKQYKNAKITFILKILIAAVTLYFVLTLVDTRQLIALFHSAKYEYVALGFLFIPFNLGVRIARWNILLSSLHTSIDWKTSARSLLVGITLGSFTPGELGDFYGRMLHLPETRKSVIVGLTLLERFQTMLSMALIAIPVLSVLFITNQTAKVLVSVGSVLLIIGIYFSLGTHFSPIVKKLSHIRYIGTISATIFTLKKKEQFESFILSLLFLLVIGIQMHFFLNAFTAVPFITSFLGTSTMLFLKSFLPISIGDLGIRELTTAFIFSKWLIPITASVNASLLLFTANVFLPACCGLIILLVSKQKFW